jgi:pimeloyl-ACP methyl ester carboxylesterase
VIALALVNTFAHYRRRLSLALSRAVLRATPAWAVAAGRRVFAPLLLFGGRRDRAAIEEFLGWPILGGGGGGTQSSKRASRAAKPAKDPAAVVWALDEGYHCRMRMIQRLDLRRDLGRVRQPVTLFASGRDRIVDSVRQASEMAGALPNVEVVALDGRGHVVLPIADIDWPAHFDRLIARAGV